MSRMQPEPVGAKCPGHGKPRLVFAGPVPVYAGAGMAKCRPPRGATVIDLAGQMVPSVLTYGISVPELASRYVRVQWDDHGMPTLTAEEWGARASALRRTRKPVMVGCAGGHGRTGTALAILGHFLRAFPAKDTDPIMHVRSVYCPEAVETAGQVAYVKAMTGRATAAQGSLGHGYSGKFASLCPHKIDGDWCNLDAGHQGDHDTRPRAVLVKAGLAPASEAKAAKAATGSSATTTVTPLSAAIGPSKWCRVDVRCMARDGHSGPCVNAVGDYITKGK